MSHPAREKCAEDAAGGPDGNNFRVSGRIEIRCHTVGAACNDSIGSDDQRAEWPAGRRLYVLHGQRNRLSGEALGSCDWEVIRHRLSLGG